MEDLGEAVNQPQDVKLEIVSEEVITRERIIVGDDNTTATTESESDTETGSTPDLSTTVVLRNKANSIWSILETSAINLFLPFINGLMLGFGEIFAHELGFRWGWSGARVSSTL
ncbi:Mim1p [Sugiyamaella lignohabitans]|uniref:Mim1p n=1 Tax=Sugiyamaella lignohabitans TaxID=796027 RepID=A0A167CJD7_9ASCO|nr:Mim1p [Sugiyamaella lignohabitans]ANB11775.1 Mim1p [Sugiyamaella lignohabitans]